MKRIKVDPDILRDAFNIYDGVYSPIAGFLKRAELNSVLFNMRLLNGSVWPLPIVLDITDKDRQELAGQDKVLLVDKAGNSRAVLTDIEVYGYNKEEYASQVFGTTSRDHPGVAELDRAGDHLLGGEVEWVDPGGEKPPYYITPEQSRELFYRKGWKTVVAFQTRNIPHRSHEYLQKQALQEAEAVLVQPVIGKKKPGDFRDEVILAGYELLLEKYYPPEQCHLASLPLKMRYAGPKEAIMHALIRRNFGCTHMIIGRDHAGAGEFYHPFEAQNIFDNFSESELGIKVLKFGEVKHCRSCQGLNFVDNCPHDPGEHISLSGTQIRERLKNGEKLPEELVRPEISELLLEQDDLFV